MFYYILSFLRWIYETFSICSFFIIIRMDLIDRYKNVAGTLMEDNYVNVHSIHSSSDSLGTLVSPVTPVIRFFVLS